MKIETEDELHAALIRYENLMDELEEVSRAIEAYEDVHYPIAKPSLLARIKFRLGQRFGWLGW